MNKHHFFPLLLLLFLPVASLLTSCNGCSSRPPGDPSRLVGTYRGEATVILPDHLKAMLLPGADKLIPTSPVPCGIRVEADTGKTLTLTLVNFTMPVQGITVKPATATATFTTPVFNIKGDGNVSVGTRAIPYTHEGNILDDSLSLDITVSIIPFIAEPKIIFKGKKSL